MEKGFFGGKLLLLIGKRKRRVVDTARPGGLEKMYEGTGLIQSPLLVPVFGLVVPRVCPGATQGMCYYEV